MPSADCHLLIRPLTGLMEESGDTGVIVSGEDACFVALVDVLGHGVEARQSAIIAEEFLPSCAGGDLVQAIRGLHERLRKGRGAVAALCELDLATGALFMSGVGNITVRVFGSAQTRLISRGGVIGYSMTNPHLERLRLRPGDVLMLYSDGIKESFDPHDCPGLLSGSAQEIAQRVMEHFRKADDDASVLVLRITP